MVQPTRVQVLADAPERAGAPYVLYWMQASQRTEFNQMLSMRKCLCAGKIFPQRSRPEATTANEYKRHQSECAWKRNPHAAA